MSVKWVVWRRNSTDGFDATAIAWERHREKRQPEAAEPHRPIVCEKAGIW